MFVKNHELFFVSLDIVSQLQVMVGGTLLFKRASDRTQICVVQHEKSTFLVCFGRR